MSIDTSFVQCYALIEIFVTHNFLKFQFPLLTFCLWNQLDYITETEPLLRVDSVVSNILTKFRVLIQKNFCNLFIKIKSWNWNMALYFKSLIVTVFFFIHMDVLKLSKNGNRVELLETQYFSWFYIVSKMSTMKVENFLKIWKKVEFSFI